MDAANPKATPTRRATRRLQSAPVISTPLQVSLNDLDMSGHQAGPEKDTLAMVMDILFDISSKLEA